MKWYMVPSDLMEWDEVAAFVDKSNRDHALFKLFIFELWKKACTDYAEGRDSVCINVAHTALECCTTPRKIRHLLCTAVDVSVLSSHTDRTLSAHSVGKSCRLIWPKCLEFLESNLQRKESKINKSKIKEKKVDTNKSKANFENVCVSTDFDSYIFEWNSRAKEIGLQPIFGLTASRKAKLTSRQQDGFSPEVMRSLLKEVEECSFLLGENKTGWKASFDWLIEDDTRATKVLEGEYRSYKQSGQSGILDLAAVQRQFEKERLENEE